IDELTIRINYKMNREEIICSQYFDGSSNIINTSLPHIYDRFRDVYEKCEIGKMTISVSPNVAKSLYNELIDSCKRIKRIDDLIISVSV
ncbi:hypothetical protein PFISCL1PPCAC_21194, partial [Pristionchus fissidentatus]